MAKNNNKRNNAQGKNRNNDKYSKYSRNNYRGKRPDDEPKPTNTPVTGVQDGKVVDRKVNYDKLCSNDISWYNKYPEFFDPAVRLQWGQLYGSPVNKQYAAISDQTNLDSASSVGMVLTVDIMSSIGSCSKTTDPVNRAFNSLYQRMLAKTSTGTLPFQQADVAMLTLGMDSFMAMVAAAKRCLEHSRLYSQVNLGYPDMILAACGVDPASVKGKQVNLCNQLNQIIHDFNAMCVPAFTDLFARHYSLYHNIWADEDSQLSQMYIMRPTGYYVYEDTNSMLKHHQIMYETSSGQPTFEQMFLTPLTTMIDAWRNTSDFNLLAGALRRAFPDNEFLTIEYISPETQRVPSVDRNMVYQINNLNTLLLDATSLDITQDAVGNVVQFKPKAMLNGPEKQVFSNKSVILNSWDSNTSPEFIMEATRMINFVGAEGYVVNATPDIPRGFQIWYLTDGHKIAKTDELKSNKILVLDAASDAEVVKSMRALTKLEQFKYAPRVTTWVKCGSEDPVYSGETGDLAVYTMLNQEQQGLLNLAAAESLYSTGAMTVVGA